MIGHTRIEKRSEVGNPSRVPFGVRVGPAASGERGDHSFGVLYVDDIALAHIQRGDGDDLAFKVSVSLASDCVRICSPSDPGGTPILSPAKSANWDVKVTFLEWDIDTYTRQIC